MRGTYLITWEDGDVGALAFESNCFDPFADISKARLVKSEISYRYVLPVIAHFLILIEKCADSSTIADILDRCIHQRNVLRGYLASFDTCLMVSKATPPHIIENRGIDAREMCESEAKCIESARWMSATITRMINVTQLSLVLSDITPLSSDPTLSENRAVRYPKRPWLHSPLTTGGGVSRRYAEIRTAYH